MNEQDIRKLIAHVKSGELSRRAFVQRMVAAGLTAPIAGMMLNHPGVAFAAADIPYKPTKAGGGGALKLLFWQAVTMLNPHLSLGTKDQEGSRVFYEPLAGWDSDGNLVPALAAEIPSKDNDGLKEDGLSVVWKLKKGVKWHDGHPFTADDVLFTYEYAKNPDAATATIGSYRDINVEKIDDFTVRVIFSKPTPFWADPFVGSFGMIIPKHLFGDYAGGKSRDAPTNLKPVGTGPYTLVDFKPGDIVLAKANPNYHVPNRPYFDTLEIKGGGDAVSAARAVLQTGEYDYAWNMQVEDEILARLESSGKGKASIVPSGSVEFLTLNVTDPAVEVDGERSSVKSRHPLFSDPAVRSAINLLIDRDSIQKYIYGRTAVATANFVNNPERFRSKSTAYEFSIEKANQILEAAGWKKGADGIRAKDGKALRFVLQTSINAPRQKTQQIIKQACQKAGMEIELKSVVASVFFGSDTDNPDNVGHFYCDSQMYTTNMTQPDPQIFIGQMVSWEVANKTNKWLGRNRSRWQNAEFDALYRQAEKELDPVNRAAMYIKMNEILVGDRYIQPIVYRPKVTAVSSKLSAPISGWDNDLWQLANWYNEA